MYRSGIFLLYLYELFVYVVHLLCAARDDDDARARWIELLYSFRPFPSSVARLLFLFAFSTTRFFSFLVFLTSSSKGGGKLLAMSAPRPVRNRISMHVAMARSAMVVAKFLSSFLSSAVKAFLLRSSWWVFSSFSSRKVSLLFFASSLGCFCRARRGASWRTSSLRCLSSRSSVGASGSCCRSRWFVSSAARISSSFSTRFRKSEEERRVTWRRKVCVSHDVSH